MKYIKQLNQDGYCIIKNIISKKECDFIKKKLEITHHKYSKLYIQNKGKLNDNSSEKIVYNLHNKHKKFIDIASNLKILNILDKSFSKGSYEIENNYVLRQLSARSPIKGSKDQQLHNDSRFIGSINPLLIVAQVAIDNFKEDNGPIRVVPKSHKINSFPKQNYKYPNEKNILLQKGDCLLFNGSLWHRGSKNKTDDTRWALLFTYARWFYKPAFDFNLNTTKNIFNKLSKKQKYLLGFNTNPPLDEFTRITSKKTKPDRPHKFYVLP